MTEPSGWPTPPPRREPRYVSGVGIAIGLTGTPLVWIALAPVLPFALVGGIAVVVVVAGLLAGNPFWRGVAIGFLIGSAIIGLLIAACLASLDGL